MMIAKKTGLLAAGCIVAGAMVGFSNFALAGDDAARAKAEETARRLQAAAELHRIGQAIIQYQAADARRNAVDPFATTIPGNDVTESFRLLLANDDPTTAPAATTQPADVAAAPTTMPAATVDSVLKQIDTAYANLHSVAFDGKITGHFEVGTVVRDEPPVSFHTTFTAPTKFRHDATDILIDSDGTKLNSFLKERSAYQTMTPPKGRAAASDWPAAAVSILQDQDPSLLLAITPSAAAQLKSMSDDIKLVPGTEMTGPRLVFAGTDDKAAVTMTFDPRTMLLQTVVFDHRREMTKGGAANVKAATVTVTYSNINPDAAVDSQQFAWAAPVDAAEVSTASTSIDAGDAGGGFAELVGKPAPDFTLNDLKGTSVKLSSLKGSVVVLDLWATWCGPCKASLPDLDKMNQELSPKGLKFYAIDLQEDQPTIEKLLKTTGWTFPVLLDTDGAVAKKFKCTGIPQTMVIGKDGVLKKVFVGMGNDKAIEALVKKEMGG